jgi:superfamily I DNA/RNA helicase
VVVDEAQDVSVSQLRFLAALGAGRTNGLLFAGDLGQRVFSNHFSGRRSASIFGNVRLRCESTTERRTSQEGVVPHEIGAFVRSAAELDRARAAVENAKLPYKVLDDNVETTTGRTSISTMHLAKGLEFRSVVVMACDDEVMPLQERIETVADDADLEEVYNRERHLLYFACTRARDHLLVTGVEPASEFLDDLRK